MRAIRFCKNCARIARGTMRFFAEKGIVKEAKLNPKIHIIVATTYLGGNINLEELTTEMEGFCDPQPFPSVILRMVKSYKMAILAFASGKAVNAGLKS